MNAERLSGSPLEDLFVGKQLSEVRTILKSQKAPQLQLMREEARDELQEARKPKGLAWHEIRRKGATTQRKRMWGRIYGDSVKREIFSSRMIGLIKAVRSEPITNLPQEERARKNMMNFMRVLGADRNEAREFADRSVRLSKRIQEQVGAKEDVSLYEKPRTRRERKSSSQ